MRHFDKYAKMKLSCQNGCDNGKPQFMRKPTMRVQEVATGEVRTFCFECLRGDEFNENSTENTLELRNKFVFWPVREDEEFQL